MGRLGLLRQPLPVLLGTAAASGRDPRRAAHHLRVGNPKIDECEVAIDLVDTDPALWAGRAGQTIIADKGYASTEFETHLAHHGIELVRPARRDERPRRGARQLRARRQIIESVNATLKTRLSSNATPATVPKASWSESFNGSSRSPPPSGTSTTPASLSCDHSPPMITNPLDFHV